MPLYYKLLCSIMCSLLKWPGVKTISTFSSFYGSYHLPYLFQLNWPVDFFQWLEFIEPITIITLAPNYSIFFCFSLINFLITFHYLFTMTKYPQCLSISIVVIPCFGMMSCVIWTTTRLQFKLFFFFAHNIQWWHFVQNPSTMP